MLKFNDLQKGKIHKLKWSKKDSNLISISYYSEKWAIIFIDILSNNIILSTYIKDPDTNVSRKLINQQIYL